MRNQIKPMFECMTKAIPYLSETRQYGLLSRAYNIMAITSINRGNAPVAVDYYLNALTCAKENHLRLDECRIHINLGYLYMQNEIYQVRQTGLECYKYGFFSKSGFLCAPKEDQVFIELCTLYQ